MSSNEFSLIEIPQGLSFDDLHLSLDEDSGVLEFNYGPIRAILEVNIGLSLTSEAEITELLSAWYQYLRLSGYRHGLAEKHLVACEAVKHFGLGRVQPGSDMLN